MFYHAAQLKEELNISYPRRVRAIQLNLKCKGYDFYNLTHH